MSNLQTITAVLFGINKHIYACVLEPLLGDDTWDEEDEYFLFFSIK